MNICLLTDDQKSEIFVERREYTKDDLLQLSILASANKTLANLLLDCSVDSNIEVDYTDLFNILTWLAEPLNAFFCETGLWENIPQNMKIEKEEHDKA